MNTHQSEHYGAQEGTDIELFSWHFFISFPRDKKLWPQVSNSLPQVNNSLPQVDNSLSKVRKSFPQVSKLFPQDSKSFLQVRKSFPQDSKSFPQFRKSFLQDNKSFPQVTKLFPQVGKSFPQVTKSFPQLRKSFPQDSKIAKCLFYGTFLGLKIFQYVTLDWVLFGTAYLAVSPLDSHTSYVPGCSKTRVCCAANCIDFSYSQLHSLIILNPFFIPITLVPPRVPRWQSGNTLASHL